MTFKNQDFYRVRILRELQMQLLEQFVSLRDFFGYSIIMLPQVP